MAWPRRYAAYLFDLDGTLVDTAPDLNAALNQTLVSAGLAPVDEALTRHWVGHGARAMLAQALANAGATGHDEAALLEQFLATYATGLSRLSRIYPTVTATLERLRADGARTAVVTNKPAALAEPLLNELGMGPLFDLIVGGDTAARPKPAADPIDWCLRRLDVMPQDTLFVGDSETDVLAARAAAIDVVCVPYGYNHGVDVATLNPDGIIASFAELAAH